MLLAITQNGLSDEQSQVTLNNALPFSTLCVLYQTVHNYEASVTDTVNYFQYFLSLHLIMASQSYDLT